MHNVAFLQDLAVVMLVAGLVTVAFRFFKQPVVLGYILAGVVIGPHMLPRPVMESQDSMHTLAELGVVFLLFALGLEFNFRKIRLIGPTAFIVAPMETGLLFLAGFEIGRFFGWQTMDCVYLGAILMISSTTIIAKTLSDMGRSREPFAQAIFGILIVEDIIAVLLVASLPGVGQTGGLDWGTVLPLLMRLLEFVIVAVVLGLLVVPGLLRFVAGFRQDETLLVTVLALCFGMSLMAAKLGFSVALGAFIMGAIIAESEEIRRIERLLLPLRDMFSAVFFVAIGMLIDPAVLLEHGWAVLVIVVALVVGKLVAVSFGCFLAGYEPGTALRVGLGLGQIGEFSFIIAGLGSAVGGTSTFLYPIAVGVSAVTTVLTPYLIQHSPRLIAWHDRLAPASLRSYQAHYLEWVKRMRAQRAVDPVRKIIRRIVLQLLVNVAIIAGVFIGAMFLQRWDFPWLRELPSWTGGKKTVLCLGALLLSLPVVVAFLRKLQALAMLLSELAIREAASARQKAALRALLSNTILFAGVVAVSLLLLVLSAPLLPSWKILVLLAFLVTGVALYLRAYLVRIYSRAQVTIQETLARPHEPHEPQTGELAKPAAPLFKDAELRTVTLAVASRASGRSIKDLALRSQTGATVIAVRRGADTRLNPGPETILAAGDEVLLFGDAVQLESGERLMSEKPTESSQ